MTNKQKNTFSSASYKKLKGFNNWPQWSDFTVTILIEKDIWDLIETGPRRTKAIIWEQKTKKNCIAIKTVIKIIKKDINNNIFNNIIDITDLKKRWDKLYYVYSQVGQKVVYSIVQELLNYFCNIKPKRFEKLVMSQFVDVSFLVKQL